MKLTQNKQQILILDYQMGNLFSIKKKLNKLNIDCLVSLNKIDIINADKIILPGVGHFERAMHNLRKLDLIDTLNKVVLEKKVPVLGICLGMQLMTNRSEEGGVEGLGWIDAEVKKFNVKDQLKYKVPHMGWNTITINKKNQLLNQVEVNQEFYFVHSYYVECNDKEDILTTTRYESDFTSSFQKENIFGVQYHPEKSYEAGNKLFLNFVNL